MAKPPRKPRISYLAAYELLQKFNTDALSDDVVVPLKVSRAMRGGVSKWSEQRNPPPLRRIQISAKTYGHRVGDIRAHNRGMKPAA